MLFGAGKLCTNVLLASNWERGGLDLHSLLLFFFSFLGYIAGLFLLHSLFPNTQIKPHSFINKEYNR